MALTSGPYKKTRAKGGTYCGKDARLGVDAVAIKKLEKWSVGFGLGTRDRSTSWAKQACQRPPTHKRVSRKHALHHTGPIAVKLALMA